jgi:ABC-2 type transport system ATP-binding protein
MTETSVLVTTGLGRRYGKRWALRECSLDLPAGHVIGLVGPNGAGKTTLLHLAAGLLEPSAGRIRVFGSPPTAPELLPRVGLVAQEKPLYSRFTVADTLAMGRWLNPRFDTARAEAHVRRADVSPGQRVGQLSGGQRAQVALAVALGKSPDLLLLDEPVANLDPLARRQFMQALLEHAAATGMTIVLSSHLLADLERACDYLVLLSASRVQLSAPTDDLLAEHRVVTGPAASVNSCAAAHTVVQSSGTDRQATLLVRGVCSSPDPMVTVRPVALEELVLAYMSTPLAGAKPALALAGPNRETAQ